MASRYAEEQLTVIFENDKMRVESILSFGWSAPKNKFTAAESDEFARVEKGEARIEFLDGETVFLRTGEFVYIKAHEKHRVSYTSDDCEWLCVYVKEGKFRKVY